MFREHERPDGHRQNADLTYQLMSWGGVVGALETMELTGVMQSRPAVWRGWRRFGWMPAAAAVEARTARTRGWACMVVGGRDISTLFGLGDGLYCMVYGLGLGGLRELGA